MNSLDSKVNNSVVDQDVRDELLDITQSFIVQAPAGSGKTELLTQRILALLANVQKPESILAITFTRKAAAEMRERVISALTLARSDPPLSSHELKRWKLASEVLKVDKEKGWNLISNPSRLNLYTIDALSASLSGALPLVSQTGTIPAIEEKSYQYYLQAAENMFQMIDHTTDATDDISVHIHNMKTLLIYKDNNLKQVVELIAQLLAKRMQWLTKVNATDHELTTQQLFDSINIIVEEKLQAVYRSFPSNILSEMPELLNQASLVLNKTDKKNVSNLKSVNDINAISIPTDADIVLWKAIAELLLTASKTKVSFYKSGTKVNGFPIAKDAENTDQAAEFVKNKAMFNELLKDLSMNKNLAELLNDVRLLPDDLENILNNPVLQSVLELLPLAAGHLKLVFQQKNLLDFNELSLSALHALGCEDNPSDVALALDYQIEHILLDEFQDTSSPQIKLLELLTAGWDLSSQKSLFLVGDPMQSIYRFRDANVSLFMQIVQFGIGQLKPKFRQLEVNFRSNQNIIEWVNHQFSHLMPQKDDFTLSAVSYAHSIAFHSSHKSSNVSCRLTMDSQSHYQQAEEVLSIVKNHLSENRQLKESEKPLKTLAILARSRSHLIEIIAALNRESVSYQAVDIEPLAKKSVVSDITQLALALTDNYDELAWASCLRSPWYALSLNDIRLILMELHNSHDSFPTVIKSLLDDKALTGKLSDDAIKRISIIQPLLNHAIKQKGKKPFVKWLSGCFEAVGGLMQIDIASEYQDLQTAIETIAEYESGGEIIDRQGLQQALDSLYAAPNPLADQQVQIMTIHKSKGLEFDRVILPRLDAKSGMPDAPLLKWTEVVDEQGFAHNLLAISKQAGKENDSVYQYISYLDKQKEKYENQRVLYVAATRAKSQLYLLGNINSDPKKQNEDGSPVFKRPTSHSFLDLLWDEMKDDFDLTSIDSTLDKSIKTQKNMTKITESELESLGTLFDDSGNEVSPLNAVFPARKVKRTNLDKVIEINVFDGLMQVESQENKAPLLEPVFEHENLHDAKLVSSKIGTVMHRQLEWLSNQSINKNYKLAENWNEIISNQLINEGLSRSDQLLSDYTAYVLKGLENTLEDEMGQFILADHQAAQSELVLHKNVLNGLFLTRIIDRTFVIDDVRWIIDYKSSEPAMDESMEDFLLRESNEYAKQMEDYVRLFKLKEGRPVIAGLYFSMLSYFHKMFED